MTPYDDERATEEAQHPRELDGAVPVLFGEGAIAPRSIFGTHGGRMASVDPRVAPPGGGGAAPEPAMNNAGNSSDSSNGGTLTGMAAVEQVFHFLDGPADVLSQCSKKPTS